MSMCNHGLANISEEDRGDDNSGTIIRGMAISVGPAADQ